MKNTPNVLVASASRSSRKESKDELKQDLLQNAEPSSVELTPVQEYKIVPVEPSSRSVQLSAQKDVHSCHFCPYPGMSVNQLTPFQKWRYVQHLLFDDPSYNMTAQIIAIMVHLLILISTVAFCLRTMHGLNTWDGWVPIEYLVSICFTFEYVARITSSSNTLQFLYQPMNVIDLLAILPFYFELIMPPTSANSSGFFIMRILRLARIFRVFKMTRYSSNLQVLFSAIASSVAALGMLLLLLCLGTILSASLMYYCERGSWSSVHDMWVREDGSPSPYSSIPASFWWAIVTMTTVGYGDVFPVTPLGKLVGACTMVCGVLVVALPVTILGSNFSDAWKAQEENNRMQQLTTLAASSDGVAARVGREALEISKLAKELETRFSNVRSALATDQEFRQMAKTASLLDRNIMTALVSYSDYIRELDH
eukprot:GILI01006863.1.p1 GENE.GILI01006863.1~~GILI01006863.1.p1  ORF type:complete len:424 (+),score=136.38 GILI01006863.1:49-1320(+)